MVDPITAVVLAAPFAAAWVWKTLHGKEAAKVLAQAGDELQRERTALQEAQRAIESLSHELQDTQRSLKAVNKVVTVLVVAGAVVGVVVWLVHNKRKGEVALVWPQSGDMPRVSLLEVETSLYLSLYLCVCVVVVVVVVVCLLFVVVVVCLLLLQCYSQQCHEG